MFTCEATTDINNNTTNSRIKILHQKQSLEFLSNQTKRISQIEHQLVELSQMVTLEQKQQQHQQQQDGKEIRIMSMNELSNLCNMLHSHHAKYLLQIEETLNEYYGYQLNKNKRNQMKDYDNDDDDDDVEEGGGDNEEEVYQDTMENLSNLDHHHHDNHEKEQNQLNDPLSMQSSSSSLPISTTAPTINDNDAFLTHSILYDEQLNRLSEGEIETDVGSTSSTSCSYHNDKGISRSSSSTTTKSYHTSQMRDSHGSDCQRSTTTSRSSLSLSSSSTTYASPTTTTNNDDTLESFLPSTSSSPRTPITPSLANLKLRYVYFTPYTFHISHHTHFINLSI